MSVVHFHKGKILLTIVFILLLAFAWGTKVKSGYLSQETIQEKDISHIANQINNICGIDAEDNPRWFLCFREKFAALTKDHSFDFVLKTLSKVQEINPKTKECHLIAHQISSSAIEKDPSQWDKLVGVVNGNYCDYGFMHGALEGRMRFDPTFSINEQTIGDVCMSIGKVNKVPNSYALCSHAMGHILLSEQGGDIPKAIDVCRKIPPAAQFNCFAGVFMEDFTRFNLTAHTGAPVVLWNEETASRLEERCRGYQGVEANACWLEMAHLYVEFTPSNPEKVFQRCSLAPTKDNQDFCYAHAEGKLFVINQSKGNQFFISVCQPYQGDSKNYQLCIKEGVGALVNNSLDSVDQATEFCKSIHKEFSDVCYGTIGNFLQALVSSKEQNELCKGTPNEYLSACTNRSRVSSNSLQEVVSLWQEGFSILNPLN